MYQELAKYPERARRFAGSMAAYTTGPGFSFDHIIRNFPWNSIGAGMVVDIGGSHGDMMIAIARDFPSLHFIVQDLPEVISSHPVLSADLAERVSFMPHNFFTEQPIKGADVYFFRWIFHGWSDKYCILLLRNLIPALKPSARLVINDFCLPPQSNTLPLSIERRLRLVKFDFFPE